MPLSTFVCNCLLLSAAICSCLPLSAIVCRQLLHCCILFHIDAHCSGTVLHYFGTAQYCFTLFEYCSTLVLVLFHTVLYFVDIVWCCFAIVWLSFMSKVFYYLAIAEAKELYHELHALDRFEQDVQRKFEDDDDKGDGIAFLRAEIKSQKKQVRHLKKKSLWSRSLEEVMEKLVDIVHFLHLEIGNAFGNTDSHKPLTGHTSNRQRLGPAGLALHYANIVLQIDTIVARSSVPTNTKDALYHSLPPNMKLALRSKLPSLCVVEELTVADITDEMEKTLQWLAPMATNTSKAHHGFGWVGEWANTGSEVNRKSSVMRVETFHHADKDKVEYYILELLLWLHRLVIRSKAGNDAGNVRPAIKTAGAGLQKSNEQSTNVVFSLLTTDEENMLQDVNMKIPIRRISKSLDFGSANIRFRENCRLTKSRSHSSGKSKEIYFNRLLSKLPLIDFDIDKERALNVIDRLDVIR
ncbi:unnamed protein product [Sphenostylis stenocarpa]|uniref:DUF668 domain-containing protein n=1 Tax=Sphenostylis stenocarpa TaxID=92480 RepID=A0AA86TI50_9FABA|nr:unnamed protein product [Sphenostylis stenocarpa]